MSLIETVIFYLSRSDRLTQVRDGSHHEALISLAYEVASVILGKRELEAREIFVF